MSVSKILEANNYELFGGSLVLNNGSQLLTYVTEGQPFAFAGSFAAASGYKVSKIGTGVSINFLAAISPAPAAGVLTSVTPLPAKYAPFTTFSMPILAKDNGVAVAGICQIQSNGTVVIGIFNPAQTTPAPAPFTGAGSTGFFEFSMSYQSSTD